jgi:hypothetical protein
MVSKIEYSEKLFDFVTRNKENQSRVSENKLTKNWEIMKKNMFNHHLDDYAYHDDKA